MSATFGAHLEKARAVLREQASQTPRIGGATTLVRESLGITDEIATFVMCRLERDKFITEPDFNGHRKLK